MPGTNGMADAINQSHAWRQSPAAGLRAKPMPQTLLAQAPNDSASSPGNGWMPVGTTRKSTFVKVNSLQPRHRFPEYTGNVWLKVPPQAARLGVLPKHAAGQIGRSRRGLLLRQSLYEGLLRILPRSAITYPVGGLFQLKTSAATLVATPPGSFCFSLLPTPSF